MLGFLFHLADAAFREKLPERAPNSASSWRGLYARILESMEDNYDDGIAKFTNGKQGEGWGFMALWFKDCSAVWLTISGLVRQQRHGVS